MKRVTYLILFLFSLVHAQEKDVVEWINENAIVIEDIALETPLIDLKQNNPAAFDKVQLFGFGESTHYGSEFFKVKTKLFKYLVENENVRLFILEDLYGADMGVNSYINGGEGSAEKATLELRFAIWETNEMRDLIRWMRDFNEGRPPHDKIKFFNIDCQSGRAANSIIKSFINKYSIVTDENFIKLIDSCAVLESGSNNRKLLRNYLNKLDEAYRSLEKSFEARTDLEKSEFNDALHALRVLYQYVDFIKNHDYDTRDKYMAENILWVLNSNKNSKAFVWAHNAHINKFNDGFTAMGEYLKRSLGDTYYSMGFDFAAGEMYGLHNKTGAIIPFNIEGPYKDNYSYTFQKASSGIFMIDFSKALQNATMKNFLQSNKKMISRGSYMPGTKGDKVDMAKSFDGIVFIKTISLPFYLDTSFYKSQLDKKFTSP